jgi:hypothetical protein
MDPRGGEDEFFAIVDVKARFTILFGNRKALD